MHYFHTKNDVKRWCKEQTSSIFLKEQLSYCEARYTKAANESDWPLASYTTMCYNLIEEELIERGEL